MPQVLYSNYHLAASKSFTMHLDEYAQHMSDKNNTPEHISKVVSRIRSIIDNMQARQLKDIDASSVQRALANRREKGMSAQTSNHYLSQFKTFLNWAVGRRYLRENPLMSLMALNVKVDRRRDRRALTVDEIESLLEATASGVKHHNMTAKDRCLLYRLALETGLRASELRKK